MRFLILPLLALVGAGVWWSMQPVPPPKPADFVCPAGHRATAIFVDRSASASADAATQVQHAQAVEAAVDATLACEGDAVKTFLVHGETDGKAYADRFVSRVANADLRDESSGSAMGLRSSYRTRIARERRNALRRSLFIASSTALPRELQMHTDLLGLLSVVEEELPDTAGVARRVVVLSDLNESMAGPGRRDFDVRPPASREEATQWAAADVAVARETYGLGSSVLRGVEVVPVLGTLASRPSATAVKAYWEALWGAFGATEIRW